uniref:Uncharacterized protein n=1 Tax=Timema shepardi TaxID=629360 RepID=A0A7R9AP17_TIMSH|nr:unnamed protein product [Timema shepardi]
MEITASLAHLEIKRAQEEGVICPSNLLHGLFVIGAYDNMGHYYSSTTSESHYHGKAISIFQIPGEGEVGEPRNFTTSISCVDQSNRKVTELPDSYNVVKTVTLPPKKPPVPIASEITSYQAEQVWGRACSVIDNVPGPEGWECTRAAGEWVPVWSSLPSIWAALAEEEGAIDTGMDNGDGFGPVRGCPRQSSLNAVLDGKTKGGKKKPGLFRGIGSMFRFGKHRKTLDVPLQMALRAEQEEGMDGFCEEREAARRAAQDEQQRIQEQYRRLMQQQRQLENNQGFEKHQDHLGRTEPSLSHPGGPPHHHHPYGHPQPHHHHHEGSNSSGASSGGGGGGGGGVVQSRSERIHQLRAQHQQRHAERRGQYPLDDREEKYEEVIRQRLEQPDYSHVRAASYDLYGEMTRPGSRVGITDPNKFSHYVNYEEIQQHLNRRQQQHYHSQRKDNRDPQQRPVSNFYEYESIQAVMRANQQRAGSVPSTTVITTDNNSNSLPRRTQHESRSNGQPMYQQHHQRIFQSTTTTKTNVVYPPSNHSGSSNANSGSGSANHHRGAHSHDMGPVTTVHSNTNYGNRGSSRGGGARTRGPFVTHVTISQQAPPPPGSKV